MHHFHALFDRIAQWHSKPKNHLALNGINAEQWVFFLSRLLAKKNQPLTCKQFVIISESLDEAEEIYDQLKSSPHDQEILFLPCDDFSPYSAIYPSETNLFKVFYALDKLAQDKPAIIIAPIVATVQKFPTKSFFQTHRIEIEKEQIIAPNDLAAKLFDLGYTASTTIEEPGTFSQRGEVFDIYPISHPPIRLVYFDEIIEHIFYIDPETNRTIRESNIEKVSIGPTPHICSRKDFQLNLRANLPSIGTQFKEKYAKRKDIFQHLSRSEVFDGYPPYLPLFFSNNDSIFNYLNIDACLISFINIFNSKLKIIEFLEQLRLDYESSNNSLDSESILPDPSNLYFSEKYEEFIDAIPHLEIAPIEVVDNQISNMENIKVELINTNAFLQQFINPGLPKPQFINETIKFFRDNFDTHNNIVFTYQTENSKHELDNLLKAFEFKDEALQKISYFHFKLKQGFFYELEKTLVLSESDLFSYKRNKTKKTKPKSQDLDYFAEQLASLKIGDYVIHSTYGVGLYKGLEKLDIAGGSSDFLVLDYSDRDKVYVPVYKLNLIQKHADSVAKLSLDSLRVNKFSKIKERAKQAAKKLAFDLLKLQAERETSRAFAFSPPDQMFREFELAFPFQETPDQINAIDSIITSMQSQRPMDHLVCGDVGFGKTEVAMRAAFKAVLDNKQVAVLVPTTILALQHYNSFKNRFKGFPVTIEFISRFKSPADAKTILEKVEKGEIDILIGTHKLLSGNMKFKDLGLVIVDEEQRFGVAHKEKLKLLKASVDFLTLTATPIPRTLQMTFLGLRDLSLIKTAPPKRQSIKTYVTKNDDEVVKLAIEKEIARGGQVFIVHNRVQDIEIYSQYIRSLVPTANIVFAHGQLPEKELEKRMTSFYRGEFQILIATTIIESGIDIPNANTMIIDRADTFGLSQLHQLRGRIGRSEKKAYAYFIIPKDRAITDIAQQRLKALYTYADMGSGFNIASCDLEIRGAGDLLGASQSGHIEAIGLELYMELLKEAIAEIKGQKYSAKNDIEISTVFSSNIPVNYIVNSSDRLKIYKKLSNCDELSKVDQSMEELEDIYGSLPKELVNLSYIIKTRIIFQNFGIKSIKVGEQSITLVFDKEFLEKNTEFRDKMVDFFLKNAKTYQFTPDYKVFYSSKDKITPELLIDISQSITSKINN